MLILGVIIVRIQSIAMWNGIVIEFDATVTASTRAATKNSNLLARVLIPAIIIILVEQRARESNRIIISDICLLKF